MRKILRERTLTVAQRELLKAACIATDQADEFRKQIEEAGTIFYRGSVHPAVAAELKLRRFIAKTLADIGLLRSPSEPKRPVGRPPSAFCGITYEQLHGRKRQG